MKEDTSMDEKKNVSFVSGLALILSALALLLIGITQITSTPYTDTMEEILDTKLQALEGRMDMKVEAGLKKLEKAEESAALRELKTFDNNLNAWLAGGANSYTDKVVSLKNQVESLIKDMEGVKAPAAQAAPPPPVKPGEKAKEDKAKK
jgi:hypothetical protein